MSLPTLLKELAVLLPERFSYDWTMRRMEVLVPMILGGHGVWRRTYYWDDTDWELDDACAFMWVENALREECEARGWEWNVWHNRQEGQYWALVSGERRADYWKVSAPTPAEALAAAMVSALAAEKGEG
ncbi:hypothetical protein [Deinococcus humi]|uniref:Phage ABA sandwich domain-containing protein n=1 Tax=Deinococcus humi TaxID=662880 RepID=A0A7W8NCH1_9DEIO|nr:hypothetical protein [Deinococcus humi]MBB5361306.1 hypothetical protein [Deinococcus humi]GGO19414.1 hypothetical protein GCM10008949_03720 [Deinococcus humi]